MALCDMKRARFKEAVESCTKALVFNSKNAISLYYRARAKRALNWSWSAEQDLQLAIQLQPEKVAYWRL